MGYSQKEINAINGLVTYLERDNSLKQINDIVPISDWINSEYYTGKAGYDIWPFWRDTIIEFFQEDKNVLILTGSLRGGKTDCGMWVMDRLLYYLSCFNYPSLRFNLNISSIISMMYLTSTKKNPEKTGYGKLQRFIDQTPYYIDHFPRNKNRTSSLNFNDKVAVYFGSDISDFQGSDLISIMFDEANFVRAGGGEFGKMEKAINIYRESTNRRKLTYNVDGIEYGASIIASSVDTITSFTETEIENNINNPKALIKHVTKYKLKPHDFSPKKFWVFIGEKNNDPFVINLDNRLKYKSLLEYLHVKDLDDYMDFITHEENGLIYDTPKKIPETHENLFANPPIDFYKIYLTDTINSLKEVDGISVQKQAKFFSENIKYKLCINTLLEHPFFKEHIVVSTKTEENELLDAFKKGDDEKTIKEKLKNNITPNYGYFGKESIRYYGAIDLSKTGDSVGLAVGHYNHDIKKIIIDIILRIDPPGYPDKVDYLKILKFVMYLRNERNINFSKIVLDNYQSEFFIQYFNKYNILSYIFPDGNDEYGIFLKNQIISDRIEYYNYEHFKYELFNLIHDIERKKLDHPPQNGKFAKDGGFGKDVFDAVSKVSNLIFISEVQNESEIEDTLSLLTESVKKRYMNSRNFLLKREEQLLGCKLQKR